VADDQEPEESWLADLSAAVADGSDVDWAGAESSVVDPADRDLVGKLRTIAGVARFYRAQDAPVAVADPATNVTTRTTTYPELWGNFTLRAIVGSGTYGTVFRAWDPRLEREVALKLLQMESSDEDSVLIREARLLARIRHPNVVTVFDADHFSGCVGLWMELINGKTLKAIVAEQGPFSAQEAVVIGLDLCGALAAVHQAQLLHRDVKAQNVMRAAGGRIVLMDFGAAAATSVVNDPAIGVRGTPMYVAPEILDGAPPSERSDLYSLGVLLYYLASGEFPVTASSVDDLRDAHARGRRRLLRDVRPDLPGAFVRAVDDATAVRPENRPASAGALEALLESVLGRRGSPSSTTSTSSLAPARVDRTRSIAVLPFTDLSAEKNLDFFCEGIAEEIANALTGVSGIRVVAPGSAFQFKGSGDDLRRVAAALNVGTVLEGSVRTSGGNLRVISRLIDTSDGGQRWSQRFDRRLDDIFAVQDEIANATVRALAPTVDAAPGATAVLAAPSTHNVDAYTLYLKGRHYWNKRNEAGLHKSVTLFQAAIEADPEYAEAYAGLAEAQTTLGLYGALPPRETMPRAREAAAQAIKLLDTLSSPFATSGCIAAVYDWNWPEGGRYFQRAIELNPTHPAAHHWYAINYLVPLGRFGEAAAHLQRAVAADPLSMPIRMSVGLRSYFARRYVDAERELRESFELDPGSVTGRLFLGLTLVELGRFNEALPELEMAGQLSRSPETVAALGYASARGGNADRAGTLLGELLDAATQRYVSPSLVAQIHAGLGETGPALDWLEKASEARAADLSWLAVRPVFDTLRHEGRFATLVGRLGL
jgi:serine/threonine-protein kinase